MAFRRKPPQPAVAEEAPPPAATPWRVPPMGSMGDAWDAEIVIHDAPALDPVVPPADAVPAREHGRRRKRRSPDEVLFRELVVQLHPGAIVVWVFVALGILSTGPAYPLMPLFGLAAVLGGAVAIWRIRLAGPDATGARHAAAGAIAGLLLIGADVVRPGIEPYEAWFIRPLGGVGRAMTFEQKIAYADRATVLMAKAALCGRQYLGPAIVGVGRDGVNRGVAGDSEYFRISTLAFVGDRTFGGIGKDALVYNEERVPPDPFADDPRATFGVFATEKYVLVYSIGPDGLWQINPRAPVAPDSADPKAELEGKLYDPATGSLGLGDIVKVFAIDEEGFDYFCEEVRVQFEEEVWRGGDDWSVAAP